ncbi:MAG TPA: TetR/AcrR family transcriptional regulator [Solirubrobacteraceae bacterium]|jgi:AcrR family transcriptional regulator
MPTTPRTARGRATRERILGAATDLVSELGVAGTSLDAVLKLAHVSKSQLYLYFPDRDALLREVAGSTCDAVLAGQADVLAAFDSVAGIESYLAALVELQVRQERPGGCPIASLAGQLADHDEQTRLILADGLDRWEQGLRSGLQTMAARGELKPSANPSLLATQTLTILQGGLLLTQVRRDGAQMRTAADTVLTLIRAALA